ncbi:DNA-3-methyladenine glycosylase 2 family protein [Lysinibacter cavernae]|uniref:DNA-3-methyladenine glycosylase II n=1 Tax=Lysinibacter cavernae TaxID=1640652 RepID=A0A7X5R185_9MICO|nr:3-methyladenine DNA glycosylase/8-oxoguanine DNA glycosylase [Lysinibacter cavernae]
MSIHLVSAAHPLDTAAILSSLAAHAVPGAERVDRTAGTAERLLPIDGVNHHVALKVLPHGIEVDVAAEPNNPSKPHLESICAVVRQWFDLDAHHEAIGDTLGDDPILGQLLNTRPWLGVVSNPHPFELAIVTVLGQQVSLAAARTFSGRLVTAMNSLDAQAGGAHSPSGLVAFPRPEAIRDAPTEWLRAAIGITGARIRTVQAVAGAFADGLSFDAEPQQLRADLLSLPGIGPWTVEYLALRGFHDPDAFPASDLVLRRALRDFGVAAAEVSAVALAWRPFRAYATVHLWNHALPPEA